MEDLRQACDRCHDKKLRCPKLPGSITCSRCTRANVPCVFSPPARSLRPGAQGAFFDWSSFPALDHHFHAEASWPEPLATPTLQTPNPRPAEAAMAKLAESLVALDRMWRLLSTQGLHQDLQHQLGQHADGLICIVDLHCSLEELLVLAQSLVVLYTDIMGISVRDADIEGGGRTGERAASGHSNGLSGQTSRRSRFDHAMMNLLFACHLRLLDVLDTLVGLAQVCADLTPSPPANHDLKFDVPEIRIGSFVAPKNTAASIFFSTLLELQAVLVEKSRKLGALFSSSGVDTALTREVKMMRLQSGHSRRPCGCDSARDEEAQGLLGQSWGHEMMPIHQYSAAAADASCRLLYP